MPRLCPLMITSRGWFETGTHEDIGRCLSQQYCGVVGPGCVVNSADRDGFVHHLCYYEYVMLPCMYMFFPGSTVSDILMDCSNLSHKLLYALLCT